jgi:hypothetical protein
MQNDLIQTFVDDLVIQAGFTHTDPQKDADYKEKLTALVSKKLGIEMMKELQEADVEEYLDLVEKESTAEELYNFFSQKIPNLDDKVVAILQNFRSQFLTDLLDAQNMSRN